MRNPYLSEKLATNRLDQLRREAERARMARDDASRARAPMTRPRWRELFTRRRVSYPAMPAPRDRRAVEPF